MFNVCISGAQQVAADDGDHPCEVPCTGTSQIRELPAVSCSYMMSNCCNGAASQKGGATTHCMCGMVIMAARHGIQRHPEAASLARSTHADELQHPFMLGGIENSQHPGVELSFS